MIPLKFFTKSLPCNGKSTKIVFTSSTNELLIKPVMLKPTPLTVKLLLVNIPQRNDMFNKFAQIAKRIELVMLNLTPLAIRLLLVNLLQQNDKFIKFA